MNEDSTFRYAAFISYRHADSDRTVARWLLERLETYRVPRDLIKKGAPARLGRCFRDEDELPASSDLSDLIRRNLESARFLIVICSPRTPESQWIGREIEFFRELGRTDRTIAVLIEGEPASALHPALCRRRRSVVDEEGRETEVQEEIEPLCADVRQRPGRAIEELKRDAVLRIAAAILGVGFDDLKRRDEMRRIRRRRIAIAIAFLVLAVLIWGIGMIGKSQADAERATILRAAAEIGAAMPQLLSASPELATLAALQALRLQEVGGALPTSEITTSVLAAAESLPQIVTPAPKNHLFLFGAVAPSGRMAAFTAPRLDPSKLSRLADMPLDQLRQVGGLFRVRDVSHLDGSVVDLEAPGSPATVGFSNDQRWFLGGTLKDLRIWSMAELSLAPRVLDLPCFPACAPAFAKDGRALVLGLQGVLRWVDVASGSIVGPELRLPSDADLPLDAGALITLSPDGYHVALGSGNDEVFVWDAVRGGEVRDRLRLPDDQQLADLQFECTGEHLVALLQAPIRIVRWAVVDRRVHGTPDESFRITQQRNEGVQGGLLLADLGLVARVGDLTPAGINLTWLSRPQESFSLQGHQQLPLCLTRSIDGRHFVSVASTEGIVWDVSFEAHRQPDRRIPVMSRVGEVEASQIAVGLTRGGPEGLAVSVDRRWAVTVQGTMFGDDAADHIHVFDLKRPGIEPRHVTIPVTTGKLGAEAIDGFGVGFARGGTLLVVGGRRGLQFIDLVNGAAPWTIGLDGASVRSLVVLPDAEREIRLALACADKRLLFAVVGARGETYRNIATAASAWIGVASAPVADRMIAAERDGRLVLSACDGTDPSEVSSGVKGVSSVALAADGATFALGLIDGRVQVRRSNRPRAVLIEHRLERCVRALTFTDDGERLLAATGSRREQMLLAGVMTPDLLSAVPGELWSLATRPDDSLPAIKLATSSTGFLAVTPVPGTEAVAATDEKGNLSFLPSSLQAARRAAARAVSRTLTESEWHDLLGEDVDPSLRLDGQTIREWRK